ncbi:pentatricopeptide repeat protein [Aspergillus steynii IBT 23096]|uniref:Pentatricopeptide repeat protein n=1 Tax=Aspergillus steynii IBT 23096 TaxID=1392250 RepID=A0A2I2FTP7_9EURO|nr:pentatricopeptide repeat protein [Aspergillus steynii IBT 23096]PLB44015.1 pentatricopeptide repeat protein [Aspergillus steynii IBT 23096]
MVYGHLGDAETLRVIEPKHIELENKIRGKTLFRDKFEFRYWVDNFSEIVAIKGGKKNTEDVAAPWANLDHADRELYEKLSVEGQKGFRPVWESLPKAEKSDHWPHLSLYLLHTAPDLAWEFLYVTCQSEDRPVLKKVFKYLDFLSKHYSSKIRNQPLRGISFDDMVKVCLDPEFWPVVYGPQRAMRLYICRATEEELRRAYALVLERETNVKPGTWLCFLNRFLHYGDSETALEALSRLPERDLQGRTEHEEGVRFHCAKLLKQDFVRDEADGRNFVILPRLLKMGIRPSMEMMNIVLHNAFKTGDSQLGHDVFKYMKTQNMSDEYTYITLLRDAVARRDSDRVRELSDEIQLRPDLSQSPYITSKLMHAHYIFIVKPSVKNPDAVPSVVFHSLLDMYNRLFDLQPLRDLAILPPQYVPAVPGANNPPPAVALFLIVSAYIRCQTKISIVHRVQTKFRSLVWEGHPTIAPMGATDHIYNEFLAFFRRHPLGLRPAVRLVEDMQQTWEEFERRPRDGAPDKSAITPAKPTIWTWNILLSTFVFKRQPYAVERVLKMMAKYGVQFDSVTWNTLLGNHVAKQDIKAAARIMKSMEEDGVAFDRHTMKTVGYFRDPERLWRAVRALDKEPELAVDQVSLDWQDSPTAKAKVLHDEADEDEDEDDKLLEKGLQRLIKKA